MDPVYAARYRELYERHWWWRAREQLILETLRRLRPEGRWGAILDVGCGDGLFFERLAELGEVEGVEPDASLVTEESRRRRRIHLVPFDDRFQPEKRYALILMLDVLEHLDAPAAALRHAVRLLAPGGIVLVTLPAFKLLWTRHDELNRHVTRYTKRSFGALAREAGLRIVEQRYFFHWLFPAKLAVRVLELVWRRAPQVPAMPATGINRSLYLASRAEQVAFRHLPLPVGSSLLAVTGPASRE